MKYFKFSFPVLTFNIHCLATIIISSSLRRNAEEPVFLDFNKSYGPLNHHRPPNYENIHAKEVFTKRECNFEIQKCLNLLETSFPDQFYLSNRIESISIYFIVEFLLKTIAIYKYYFYNSTRTLPEY